MIKVTFRSSKEEKAKKAAEEFAKRARLIKGLTAVGPAPSPVIKVRGQFRWNCFLKFKPQRDFSSQLRGLVEEFKKGKGAFMIVDTDPITIG